MSSGISSPPFRVIEGAAAQHGDEDVEQAIGDTPQGAGVTVTFPEALVMRPTTKIEPDAVARPVKDRRAQVAIAAAAHGDDPRLAALTRDRGRAGVRTQSLVVSGGQRPRRLSEHRGGDDSPDSRQGPEDRHVTMLIWVLTRHRRGQPLQEALEPPLAPRALLVYQLQARQEQAEVLTGRFDRARGHGQRGLLQRGAHDLRREAPDPRAGQQRPERAQRTAPALGRGGRLLQQGPEPGLIGGGAEREELGIETHSCSRTRLVRRPCSCPSSV